MELALLIPWYVYAIAGALLGLVIGLVFKGMNFANYFGGSLYVLVGGFVLGVLILFGTLLANPTVTGTEAFDIFVVLCRNYIVIYVTHLITAFLFKS